MVLGLFGRYLSPNLIHVSYVRILDGHLSAQFGTTHKEAWSTEWPPHLILQEAQLWGPLEETHSEEDAFRIVDAVTRGCVTPLAILQCAAETGENKIRRTLRASGETKPRYLYGTPSTSFSKPRSTPFRT